MMNAEPVIFLCFSHFMTVIVTIIIVTMINHVLKRKEDVYNSRLKNIETDKTNREFVWVVGEIKDIKGVMTALCDHLGVDFELNKVLVKKKG